MQQVNEDILAAKYTTVYHEEESEIEFNAPHHFKVCESNNRNNVLAEVFFQKGPIKENGVNGVHNEDLIGMVICRLEYFQKSEYSCRENAIAISRLEEALQSLRKRTISREKRGVEGTSQK